MDDSFVLECPSDFKLLPRVVIGYSDVSNAGLRALLGISSTGNWVLDSIKVKQLKDVLFVSRSKQLDPIQVIHFSDAKEPLSLVVINTSIPEYLASILASHLVNLFHQQRVKELMIVAAIHFLSSNRSIHFFSRDSPSFQHSGLHEMDPATKIKDAFVNSLLHFSGVTQLPTLLICLDGEKMRPGKRGKNDVTLPVVRALAEQTLQVLHLTSLSFDEDFVCQLEVKRNNDKEDDFLYI